MLDSMEAASSSGTKRNQEIQARVYLHFMITNNYNYKFPSILQILLYTQLLANSYKSPDTIRNYVSGAKTIVKKLDGNHSIFDDWRVVEIRKGIKNKSIHIPNQAPRIPLRDLMNLTNMMLQMQNNLSGERAAVLCMYSTFLRQSNVLWCESSGARHLLLRQHIWDDGGPTIWVHVHSSKSTTGQRPRAIPIKTTPGVHCPVAAWRSHRRSCPGDPASPAFQTAEGHPIMPSILLETCRVLMTLAGSVYKNSFTFHSLRRTGALEASERGASEMDVRAHGLWSPTSPAYHRYVPKTISCKAAEKISQSLAS